MFRFANPWALVLLVLLPALLLVYLRRQRGADVATWRFSSLRLTVDAPVSFREVGRHLLMGARLMAMALIIVGLARPQTGQAHEVARGDGIDIMLVLDMSGSMGTEDFQPKNRLEVAKQVITEFIEGRRFDRIGLVVFARQSYLQCPLTLDYDVLIRLLDEVHLAPDLGLEDGTAIGVAIASGVNHLKDSTGKSKVVILLTDGNNNAGQIDPITAAQAASALGVKVYTIGAGKPGAAPASVRDLSFAQRAVNTEAELDEETLRKVAETAGGLYFRATDGEALHEIYQQISEMEKTEVEIRRYTRYREWANTALFPGLGLLLLELLLRNTWLRVLP